jgi:hypothetical protein
VTYELRQRLGLRRTGSIDVDKEARERARRDRYNAKRRARRAAAKAAREAGLKAREASSKTSGVNRTIPSLESVTNNHNLVYNYNHNQVYSCKSWVSYQNSTAVHRNDRKNPKNRAKTGPPQCQKTAD